MHGYVVPSRIGTFACTTLQLEFSIYSGKIPCKNKYVKILELINKVKKKAVVSAVGYERSGPGFKSRRLESDFSSTHLNQKKKRQCPSSWHLQPATTIITYTTLTPQNSNFLWSFKISIFYKYRSTVCQQNFEKCKASSSTVRQNSYSLYPLYSFTSK